MQITCPHCKKSFDLDDTEYAYIQRQVRDDAFLREVESRVHDCEQRAASQIQAVRAEEAVARQQLESKHATDIAAYRSQVARLTENAEATANAARAQATVEAERAAAERQRSLENELAQLRATTQGEQLRQQAAVAQALDQQKASFDAKYATLQQERNNLQEEFDRLKSFKMARSTKTVGEDLEQWCAGQFERMHAQAYPHASFQKDTVSDKYGEKGDFIFRDFTPDGFEFVSVMFEMKNETENGKTKNEQHYKKLDSNRQTKGCEYAVLVTTLEPDNPAFESGILDISYRYPKMYVVRPEYFLQVLGLIDNAARASLAYKRELEKLKQTNIDIMKFEAALETGKQALHGHCEKAEKKLEECEADIDKVIESLEAQVKALKEIKQGFSTYKGHCRHAAGTFDKSLSMKELSRDNPTVKALLIETGNSPD